MPFVNDSKFDNLDDNEKIWRYTDFAKLVSLFHSESLYFVRSDRLLLSDPFEGYFRELTFLKGYNASEQLNELARKEHPKNLFINCWHVNKSESDAMWKIYSGMDKGIAIQSTIGKLKNGFKTSEQVKILKMKYGDFQKENGTREDLIDRFSRKRDSFKHENELRVFVFNPSHSKEDGIKIKMDLKSFIEKITVSPLSPDWFVDVVKSVSSKYGIDQTVVDKSKLFENPFK